MRIVDHGIAIGRLRHICLHVPRPNGTEDAINVVLPAATTLQQNAALVAKVGQRPLPCGRPCTSGMLLKEAVCQAALAAACSTPTVTESPSTCCTK